MNRAPIQMNSQRIYYHGTNEANALSIQKEGFRVGTYFADDYASVLAFGGPFVFQVAFDEIRFNNRALDDWQFWIQEVVSPDKIVSLHRVERELLFENKILVDTVFWSQLTKDQQKANERVGITFDPAKGITDDKQPPTTSRPVGPPKSMRPE